MVETDRATGKFNNVKTAISIVTIVKNDQEGLRRTIESVKCQEERSFQYVVIDGASCDGTLAVAHQESYFIDIIDSRHDMGISDAFNRGIALSSGNYILMLNAGDTFINAHALSIINANAFPGKGDDIVCCGVINEVCGVIKPGPYSLPGEIPHQGMFVGRDVYQLLGGYSLKYGIRMDYEFVLRCKTTGIKFRFLDHLLCHYRAGGKSNLLNNRVQFYSEGVRAEIQHLNRPMFDSLLHLLYWKLKLKLRKNK